MKARKYLALGSVRGLIATLLLRYVRGDRVLLQADGCIRRHFTRCNRLGKGILRNWYGLRARTKCDTQSEARMLTQLGTSSACGQCVNTVS